MGFARLGIGLLLACAALAAQAGEIVGPATVTDGDTLVVGGTHVRLFGIDAPESRQLCQTADGADWPCGSAARDRAAALVAGQEVRCEPVDTDRYGRAIAHCSVEGADLGGRLVSEGLAWAYVHFSRDYVGAEAEARAARRGIWQGTAEAAWDWRADGGFVPAAAETDAPDPGCRIKGNINSKGGHIYHQPQDRDYAKVHITTARGERWFCSPEEAEAAGWRPAGGGR